MKFLLAATLAICLAAESGKEHAYTCNNNYYVNSSGHSCTRPPAARSTRSARRNAAMAALAFQNINVGRAHTTVA
jgi:hypothetical protein